jgi:hypothetical protein
MSLMSKWRKGGFSAPCTLERRTHANGVGRRMCCTPMPFVGRHLDPFGRDLALVHGQPTVRDIAPRTWIPLAGGLDHRAEAFRQPSRQLMFAIEGLMAAPNTTISSGAVEL